MVQVQGGDAIDGLQTCSRWLARIGRVDQGGVEILETEARDGQVCHCVEAQPPTSKVSEIEKVGHSHAAETIED